MSKTSASLAFRILGVSVVLTISSSPNGYFSEFSSTHPCFICSPAVRSSLFYFKFSDHTCDLSISKFNCDELVMRYSKKHLPNMRNPSQILPSLYCGPLSYPPTKSLNMAERQLNSPQGHPQGKGKTRASKLLCRLKFSGKTYINTADKPDASQGNEEKSGTEEPFSAVSGAVDLAVMTLRDAASFVPIPWLSNAAGLAVGIWQTVQTTHDVKNSLRSLAEDSLGLVITVLTTCEEVLQRNRDGIESADSGQFTGNGRGLEKLSLQLENSVIKLCSTLEEISDFAKRHAARNTFIRFLTSKSDTGKVVEYQGKIKNALDIFTLQANINTQQVLSRIEAQQKALRTQVVTSPVPTHKAGASVPADTSSPDLSGARSTGGAAPALSLRDNGTVKAAGPGIGAVAFPTIFSFAGATFQIGRGAQKGQRATKMEEEDVEAADDSSDPAGAACDSNGVMKFTSISGDQNITRVNDNSQRWNYGNVYNNQSTTSSGALPFSALTRERIDLKHDSVESGLGTPLPGHSGTDLNERGQGERGRQGRTLRNLPDASPKSRNTDTRPYTESEFDITMDRNAVPNAFESYYDDDAAQSRGGGDRWHNPRRRWQDNDALSPPRQTYYDENGVPRAVPRSGGRRWQH
ncbi:hypothetical protein GYMLUDRAFT_73001 [Collybiopsis luxurians FD-317 M1]|uniref:Fungal N-terminal domain-containing protein n=1 Tax=Collybiopsis luxurians FD-317 M1 TaxID=944289 RepID=A0A0D0CHA2_9AGAR|nr:hypothetical protein GYMLUDRAFT_73001 [Collybiopsis luxurians FD-317 M1]